MLRVAFKASIMVGRYSDFPKLICGAILKVPYIIRVSPINDAKDRFSIQTAFQAFRFVL